MVEAKPRKCTQDGLLRKVMDSLSHKNYLSVYM